MAQEVLSATQELYAGQVRVVELLKEFCMGLGLVDLDSLHHVAEEVEARLSAQIQWLESLLAKTGFQPGCYEPLPFLWTTMLSHLSSPVPL